jgi:microcystin-dependent protein
VSNLPGHNHLVGCDAQPDPALLNPSGAIPDLPTTAPPASRSIPAAASNASMNRMINSAGNGQPFSNTNPFLGINFIICVEGIFPSRN